MVSDHVTAMAGEPRTGVFGLEETFPWPLSTGPQDLAPVTMLPSSVFHPVASLPGRGILEPEGSLEAA